MCLLSCIHPSLPNPHIALTPTLLHCRLIAASCSLPPTHNPNPTHAHSPTTTPPNPTQFKSAAGGLLGGQPGAAPGAACTHPARIQGAAAPDDCQPPSVRLVAAGVRPSALRALHTMLCLPNAGPGMQPTPQHTGQCKHVLPSLSMPTCAGAGGGLYAPRPHAAPSVPGDFERSRKHAGRSGTGGPLRHAHPGMGSSDLPLWPSLKLWRSGSLP